MEKLLPIEKEFEHHKFAQQIQGISLEEAKKLLLQLHYLYLGQQHTMMRIVEDMHDSINS
jgi:hypothetical protein